MLKNHKQSLKLIPALFLLGILIFSAGSTKAAAYDALLLCGGTIIPSLFPFFVLSAFLTRLGLPGVLGRLIAPAAKKLYNISPAGASALVMGFFGGYPAGANYIADMEKGGLISPGEAERLLAFCNNSGPAFIVGVMGSAVFGSVKTGLRLYLVHIISALITGIFFRRGTASENAISSRLDEISTGDAIVKSVKQSVVTILDVCGFIICFSVLISMLDTGGIFAAFCQWAASKLGTDVRFIKALVTGFLELGNGAAALAGLDKSPLSLALAAAMLAWGGLSVHFQTLAVLSGSKIKGTLHMTGRLISAVFAFIIMFLVSSL